MDYDELRQAYERDVRALKNIAEQMRADGDSWEAVARALVELRNGLKVRFRAKMKREDVEPLEGRNQNLYDNPIGPNADQQFARYDDWRAVAEAASRPGRLRKSTTFAKFIVEQRKKPDGAD